MPKSVLPAVCNDDRRILVGNSASWPSLPIRSRPDPAVLPELRPNQRGGFGSTYRGRGIVTQLIASGNAASAIAAVRRDAVANSSAPSTQRSRTSAVNAWTRYCSAIGGVPENLIVECIPLPDPQIVNLICDFICAEFIRGMQPTSLKMVYIPAIAKYFAVNEVENHFGRCSKHPTVKILFDGLYRKYFRGCPRSGTRRLAFTAEYLRFVKEAMLERADSYSTDIHDKTCEFLALKFGMWYCLRKSEYLPNGKYPQFPRFAKGLPLDCVILRDVEGFVIPFADIRVGSAATLTVRIIFSKTDQEGIGRVRTTTACLDPSAPCLVREIEDWLGILRDRFNADPATDHLFVVKDRVFICADRVAEVIKATVLHAGLDPSRYSAHSLRYGGATMLASAGIPIHLVEYMGGWAANSASLRGYLQLGSLETEGSLTAVFRAAESNLSLSAVRARHSL